MTPTALRRDGSFSGRRALVVDDNATNRRLMTALLGAWGMEVVEAADGDEALATLGDGTVDVAVLDMLMPGPDGLDVAASLHERSPDVPVVIASSIGRREIDADPRWETAGVGAFVTKPIKASAAAGGAGIGAGRHARGRERGATATRSIRSWARSIRSASCWPRTTP